MQLEVRRLLFRVPFYADGVPTSRFEMGAGAKIAVSAERAVSIQFQHPRSAAFDSLQNFNPGIPPSYLVIVCCKQFAKRFDVFWVCEHRVRGDRVAH